MQGEFTTTLPQIGLPYQDGTATLPSRDNTAVSKALKLGIALSMVWPLSFVIGFKTSVAAITAAGIVLLFVGLRRPLYGLVGIGMLCSVDSMSRTFLATGGLFRYNTLNYCLVAVMCYSLPMLLRLNDVHTWLLRLFACLLVAELVWTSSLEHGVLNILNMITVFGIFVYFYRSRKQVRMWYVLGITVGLSSALAGLAFTLNGEGMSYISVREEYRINDIYDRNYIDPNAYCYTFLVPLFSITLALASKAVSRNERSVLYGLFAVNSCWIMLTGSRGGILVAAACTLFLLLLLQSHARRFKFIIAFALGSGIVVSSFPVLMDRTLHRVDKLFDQEYSAAQRTSARSDHYVGAWQLFRKNPLGVGTGGYKKSWAKLRLNDGRSSQAGFEKAAHSAWLKTLVENGVPGIILLAMIVGSFAYVGFHKGGADLFPFGVLVTVMIASIFVSTEFWSKSIWFIIASAIVFLHYRELPTAPDVQHPIQNRHDPTAPTGL